MFQMVKFLFAGHSGKKMIREQKSCVLEQLFLFFFLYCKQLMDELALILHNLHFC